MEQLILGTVQGIAEWLPISSESLIFLLKANLFNNATGDVESLIKTALLLHMGTFLAALIYFRKDVAGLFKTLLNYKKASIEDRNIFKFLFVATLISGFIGLLFFEALVRFGASAPLTVPAINLSVGLLLIVTGVLQIRSRDMSGGRSLRDVKYSDGVILGFMQGLSVLPGLSRSGLTVSALLLRRFDDVYSLKLSFLMSLPIVLIGNIYLNFLEVSKPIILSVDLWGLAAAFIFGLLTIHYLLKLAKRINFGWFVIIFGILVLLSVVI